MRYGADLGGRVQFDPGTSLLFSGPTQRTEDALLDTLATGIDAGESVILITTNRDAATVVAELDERGALAPDRLGIVDCSSGEGESGTVRDVRVRQLASPGDLTGISLEFAKLLQSFEEAGVADDVRVGMASVSTLLMYTDVQTVFRFLHVFTSRIRSADLFGLFTLDPDMHEDQTVNTVRAIYDCEAVVTEDDVDLRGAGFSRV